MNSSGVTFLPLNRTVQIAGEETLLQLALTAQIPIFHECGGMGSCTTCRVLVLNGAAELPARNAVEQEMAEMKGFAENERLSCQLPPRAGLVVQIT